MDEERRFYYSASWQFLQEETDADLDGTIDDRAQQVWGLRYIDDAALRRTDAGADGTWEAEHFYLTDGRYSAVVLADASGRVMERNRYTAFGTSEVRRRRDKCRTVTRTDRTWVSWLSVPRSTLRQWICFYWVAAQ